MKWAPLRKRGLIVHDVVSRDLDYCLASDLGWSLFFNQIANLAELAQVPKWVLFQAVVFS